MVPEILLAVPDFIEKLNPLQGPMDTISMLVMGFKLVVLLFIVSFVRSRFGGGTLVTVLVLVFGYVVLFQYWWIFGPLSLIYLIIVFGFTGILFDLVLAKPWQKHGGGGESFTDSRDFGKPGHAGGGIRRAMR